jgi:hypothetical protein
MQLSNYQITEQNVSTKSVSVHKNILQLRFNLFIYFNSEMRVL